jgi:hypothetical protein
MILLHIVTLSIDIVKYHSMHHFLHRLDGGIHFINSFKKGDSKESPFFFIL